MRHVVTNAKGIYSPERIENPLEIAFSIRQTLTSPYGDKPVQTRANGSWIYLYHQEGDTQDFWTNQRLLNSMTWRTPVVVLIQRNSRPSEYHIQGLAIVTGYHDKFFCLEGFSTELTANLVNQNVPTAEFLADLSDPSEYEDVDLAGLEKDSRLQVFRQISARQGQGKFRDELLDLYSGRCAISGVNVPEALDAAHILPFKGQQSNHAQNGLIIRSDLHNLLDSGLLAIDPVNRTSLISERLRDTEYWSYHGREVLEPKFNSARPADYVLQRHLVWCGPRLAH